MRRLVPVVDPDIFIEVEVNGHYFIILFDVGWRVEGKIGGDMADNGYDSLLRKFDNLRFDGNRANGI